MARVNITVPDEVIERARAAGLNVSRLATAALVVELDRLAKIALLDAHLDRLADELGPIPADEAAEATAWVDAVLGSTASTAAPTNRRRRSA